MIHPFAPTQSKIIPKKSPSVQRGHRSVPPRCIWKVDSKWRKLRLYGWGPPFNVTRRHEETKKLALSTNHTPGKFSVGAGSTWNLRYFQPNLFKACHCSIPYESYDMNLFSMQRSSSEMAKKINHEFRKMAQKGRKDPWTSHGNPWPFQKDSEDLCQLLSSHLMGLTCYKGSHMRHDARNFNQGTNLDERIRKDMKGDGELLISLIANITVGISKSDLNLVL